MARGFKTGGRRLGSLNKRTAAHREAARQVLDSASAALGDRMQDIDAHTLLKLVYRNAELDLGVRLDAAKAALRHETPVMATTSVDLTVSNVPPDQWSDDQLRSFIAAERARQGLPAPDGQPIDVTPDCVENPPRNCTQ